MLEKLATNIIGGILSFAESFSQENKNFKRLNKLWVEQGTLFSWGLRVVYDEELFAKFYNGPYDRALTKRIYRNAVGSEDALHQNWYKHRIDQLRQLNNYRCSVCPPGEE